MPMFGSSHRLSILFLSFHRSDFFFFLLSFSSVVLFFSLQRQEMNPLMSINTTIPESSFRRVQSASVFSRSRAQMTSDVLMSVEETYRKVEHQLSRSAKGKASLAASFQQGPSGRRARLHQLHEVELAAMPPASSILPHSSSPPNYHLVEEEEVQGGVENGRESPGAVSSRKAVTEEEGDRSPLVLSDLTKP